MADIFDEFLHFTYDTWIPEAGVWVTRAGYINQRAEEPRGGIGINPPRPDMRTDDEVRATPNYGYPFHGQA
jgi:hypothetical protein